MNNVDNVSTGLEKENSTSFLLQKQCDNYFSQGNPSIINKALNKFTKHKRPICLSNTFLLFLPKSLKSFHDLASKSSLNLVKKLNYLLLKTLFLLRSDVVYVLFIYLFCSSCNFSYITQ